MSDEHEQLYCGFCKKPISNEEYCVNYGFCKSCFDRETESYFAADDIAQKFPIVPMNDNFIAEELCDGYRTSDEGFLMSNDIKDRPMRVRVISVSETYTHGEWKLNPGDIVLLPKYGSIGIKYGADQKKFQLCSKSDIIGILLPHQY